MDNDYPNKATHPPLNKAGYRYPTAPSTRIVCPICKETVDRLHAAPSPRGVKICCDNCRNAEARVRP